MWLLSVFFWLHENFFFTFLKYEKYINSLWNSQLLNKTTQFNFIRSTWLDVESSTVPDLPLCLGVHRASLARGSHLPAKYFFTMDFCLCGAILNLKAFCFGAIPDIMIELIAYWSVPQSRQSWQWLSGIETKLLGASGYWQTKKLKMDSCLRGAILNLTAFCSIWTLIEECSSIK
jgi:hypothetical protein